MAIYSLIVACPLNLDEALEDREASSERDLETLVDYANHGAGDQLWSEGALANLRVSVERYRDSIESVTVKTMSGTTETPEEVDAFLRDLQTTLPAYFPEILHAYSQGCRFVTFDANLDEIDSWQMAKKHGEVSAHETIAIWRRARAFLLGDNGFADSPDRLAEPQDEGARP